MVLLGRVISSQQFDPSYAMLLQNLDELRIPLKSLAWERCRNGEQHSFKQIIVACCLLLLSCWLFFLLLFLLTMMINKHERDDGFLPCHRYTQHPSLSLIRWTKTEHNHDFSKETMKGWAATLDLTALKLNIFAPRKMPVGRRSFPLLGFGNFSGELLNFQGYG